MMDWLAPALALINLALLVVLLLRRGDDRAQAATQEATRELRAELQDSARGTRQELGQTLALFQQTLLAQQGDAVRTQNEQIDTLRTQLATMQQVVGSSLQGATQALAAQAQSAQESTAATLLRGREAQDAALRRFADSFGEQVQAMRTMVEQRLASIQADNEKKLEQMRATVDEKLHATLEQRLGESFRHVAERLEQVHRGLGEMQGLAKDVGALNRVLTNVKTRGNFGEVQLGALLDEVFTPDQIGRNVETVPGSNMRVDYALRLPGRRSDHDVLWLPIDAKFPREDYERLLDAQERADAPGAELAARAIEMRLRAEARSIREKYVAPPHTADFAILFVPTEGLYAEALRRPGLVEAMQRDHRVMLAGPTTLLATLNSLQMGFRTLALEKRSAEVWEVLGAVKTEFAKFGEVLAKTKKKLEEASNTIDEAQKRSRVMTRKLKSVEELDAERAQELLPGFDAGAADEDGS
jgi:DNA recombination protein RmuC